MTGGEGDVVRLRRKLRADDGEKGMKYFGA